LFLVIPAGIVYGLRYFVNIWYLILVALIIIPFGVLCAFYKVNGRPFYYAILSFSSFAVKPQIYLWRKVPGRQKNRFRMDPKERNHQERRGLDELSWRVDIGE
jgi:hypothetical protein